jgi:hypothetical protein
VASFGHTIPPGGEGKITLKVHTRGYQGSIYKSARVNTNDREQNVVNLGIKAFIKVPVLISPRYVSFYGKPGQSITKVIEIKAGLNNPLTLSQDQFDLEGKVKYTLEEIEKGRRFKIHLTSIPGSTPTFSGALRLKTNYPEKPIITITITGRFVKIKN